MYSLFAVNNIFRFAMPEQCSVFLPVINDNHLSLYGIELICQAFTCYRKIELFGRDSHVLITSNAAKNHFAFIGFNQITFVREFLQQSGAVTIAESVKVLSVDKQTETDYRQSNNAPKYSFNFSLGVDPS